MIPNNLAHDEAAPVISFGRDLNADLLPDPAAAKGSDTSMIMPGRWRTRITAGHERSGRPLEPHRLSSFL
jgi:hypothetical protein